MSLARVALVAALLVAGPGCAAIARSDTEFVEISTSPNGAMVFADGVFEGYAPVRLTYPRNEHRPLVRVWLKGYRPQEAVLARGIDGGGIACLVCDVVVGAAILPIVATGIFLAIDFNSGNFYGFEADQALFELEEGDDPKPAWVVQPAWAEED